MNSKEKKEKNLNYEVADMWVLHFWAVAIAVAYSFGGREGAVVIGFIATISLLIQLVNVSSLREGETVFFIPKK
ncbi:MAG: hypothetical protein R6U11_11700 [Bacteroidales bacterium]